MNRASGLVAIIALAALASAARAESEADKGLRIAKQHCDRCHRIGDGRRMNDIGSTPSFPLLVNQFSDWRERFATFYSRRPHPSFVRLEGIPPPTKIPSGHVPVSLKPEDVDHVTAYAASLRTEKTP